MSACWILEDPPVRAPHKITHPAKWSNVLIDTIKAMLPAEGIGWDPFGGTGKSALFATDKRFVVCSDLEEDFVRLGVAPGRFVANALCPPFRSGTFAFIVMSLVFGNRMSDAHFATEASTRNTYTHGIGHALHPDNAGAMHWAPEGEKRGGDYRNLHRAAYPSILDTLVPGGVLVIEISDFLRTNPTTKKTERMEVSRWHRDVLVEMGMMLTNRTPVEIPRNRNGANWTKRVETTDVWRFRKPLSWTR